MHHIKHIYIIYIYMKHMVHASHNSKDRSHTGQERQAHRCLVASPAVALVAAVLAAWREAFVLEAAACIPPQPMSAHSFRLLQRKGKGPHPEQQQQQQEKQQEKEYKQLSQQQQCT